MDSTLCQINVIPFHEGLGAELKGTLRDIGHDLGESLLAGPTGVPAAASYLVEVNGLPAPVLVTPSPTLRRQLEHLRLVPGDRIAIYYDRARRPLVGVEYVGPRSDEQIAALIEHIGSAPGRMAVLGDDGQLSPIEGSR